MTERTTDLAKTAYEAGMNIVPQGKKIPLIQWGTYQNKRIPRKRFLRWLKIYPTAHWSLICGMFNGIIVLDFDGDVGIETMENLGLIPFVFTPGGGAHVWVKSPPFPVSGGARLTQQFPGMDLKSDGQLATFIGEGYSWNPSRKVHAWR